MTDQLRTDMRLRGRTRPGIPGAPSTPKPPAPPSARPAQPPGGYTGPVTITKGGTYEVAAEATGLGQAAVIVANPTAASEDQEWSLWLAKTLGVPLGAGA